MEPAEEIGQEVTGNTITIHYHSPVAPEAWIQIDTLRLVHQLIDTTGRLNDPTYNPLELYLNDPEQPGGLGNGYLPPSFYYENLSKRWFRSELHNSRMAYYCVSVINQRTYEASGATGEPIYAFKGNQFMLFQGKLTFSRTDNQPITVRTSKNYGATIYADE
jgi:hypothetical protein